MARTLHLLMITAAVLLAAPAAAAARDAVLVVGDSLEVGTGPPLKRELAGTAVTVDARIGRPSGEGVRVLRARLRPEHQVVVFDLGVNDSPSQPGVLAGDLAAARRLAGQRCMVVATMQRPPLNGVTVAGLNSAVEGFAGADPAVHVVDWHAAADPALLNPDGLHPTPEGYAVRARLVAEGVRACQAGGGPAPAEPKLPPLPRAAPAPRRPLLLNWGTLAHSGPVGGVLAVLTGGIRAVAAAEAAALPSGPEPVLGDG